MKQIKNIRNFLLISLIAGGTWIGCDDANYSTLDTHVFFEEALTATSTKVTVMGSGETNVTLNAHISNTQQKDNSIKKSDRSCNPMKYCCYYSSTLFFIFYQ